MRSSILKWKFITAICLASFLMLWQSALTKRNFRRQGFLFDYSSKSETIVVGESRQKPHRAGHITSIAKSKGKEIHTHLFSCLCPAPFLHSSTGQDPCLRNGTYHGIDLISWLNQGNHLQTYTQAHQFRLSLTETLDLADSRLSHTDN